MESLIWDLGCGYGQNINYFLRKADRLIVVDARLDQIEKIRSTFANAISIGRLQAIHGCLTDQDEDFVTFYEHPSKPWLSRTILPSEEEGQFLRCRPDEFRAIELPALRPADLLEVWGEPMYVKTDLETAEISILSDLFRSHVPGSVSAELHDRALFSLLGQHYQEFTAFRFWPNYARLRQGADGRVVRDSEGDLEDYAQEIIDRNGDRRLHRFARGACGPCLNDLNDWHQDPNLIASDVVSTYGPTWETNGHPLRPWIDVHARSPKSS